MSPSLNFSLVFLTKQTKHNYRFITENLICCLIELDITPREQLRTDFILFGHYDILLTF